MRTNIYLWIWFGAGVCLIYLGCANRLQLTHKSLTLVFPCSSCTRFVYFISSNFSDFMSWNYEISSQEKKINYMIIHRNLPWMCKEITSSPQKLDSSFLLQFLSQLDYFIQVLSGFLQGVSFGCYVSGKKNKITIRCNLTRPYCIPW